ncbi:hypothetical protein UVI_02049830 [Ustilaginoidea virens]|uniref:Uncharacterized protein n=1 Tax=Ustilaginoidea virens TaxID=1159556 RepID=A0A1B5KZ31_USTVR|nr:hypothetical protein UVI_02049830 [Ustilaginoidea virens]
MAVKLNMKAQPTLGAVAGCWNRAPGPWAWLTPLITAHQPTYQMSNPKMVQENRTKQAAKGICSRSGRMRMAGAKAQIHITRPIKSLVSRWESAEKEFCMWARPGGAEQKTRESGQRPPTKTHRSRVRRDDEAHLGSRHRGKHE